MEHQFTTTILAKVRGVAGELTNDVYGRSELLQYLNEKTRSVNRGSKARSSFGNIYALYVLIEDYLTRGQHTAGGYSEYDGARFVDLLKRLRELPFGAKLQNHSLNHRVNQEFARFFPTSAHSPILRDAGTRRYWINESLLRVAVGKQQFNLASVILAIIDEYVGAKTDAFEEFLRDCSRMLTLKDEAANEVRDFVRSRLEPNVDARIFEIISYAILREYYQGQRIYWGWSRDEIREDVLTLFKTGRTNANDGGIDFVMKPLGRFFQVTETTDVGKYFLDIDKVQRYPLTFVIKSDDSPEELLLRIERAARSLYPVSAIVARYLDCIEEIINIEILLNRFDKLLKDGRLGPVIEEIVTQSKVEFNYSE